MDTLLVSTAYLPPVDYLVACMRHSAVVVDGGERYAKQTYRNRCEIGHSQGRLALVVPVVRPEGHRTGIRSVRLDHSTSWVRNHLGAIRSAYGRTPFFEHYFPDLSGLLSSRLGWLLEFNSQLLAFLLSAFGSSASLRIESWGQMPPPPSYCDMRHAYHPKRARPSCGAYYQSFGDRLPFLPNLSAIDLLFNEGPHCVPG